MDVIDFARAKKTLQDRRYKEREKVRAFKLRYMSNSELFKEYIEYRKALEEGAFDDEGSANTESLLYLCEVALEVTYRGLLKCFDKRFNIISKSID